MPSGGSGGYLEGVQVLGQAELELHLLVSLLDLDDCVSEVHVRAGKEASRQTDRHMPDRYRFKQTD
jgi:hypothetical protein